MIKPQNVMSLLIFFGLYIFFSGTTAYGGWEVVNLPDVSAAWVLNSVHFTLPDEGWAVGTDLATASGVLLHHLNGTWTAVNPPHVSAAWGLNSVHFITPKEGWAVGEDQEGGKGVLLHYLNGTWTAVNPPYVSPGFNPPYVSSDWVLNSVHFTSPNEGWAVGTDLVTASGVLLHYLNGTWTAVNPPYVSPSWNLRSVFVFSSEAWAVGEDQEGGKGVLLHYQKGTWIAINPGYESSEWGLYGIQFTWPAEGWAVGFDWDGGKGVLLHFLYGSWIVVNPPYVSSKWGLHSVHLTYKEGWAVGEDQDGGKGVLLHYLNDTWTAVNPPYVSSEWGLRSVDFIFPSSHFNFPNDWWGDEGWAVGMVYDSNYRGLLLRYSEVISVPSLIGPISGTPGTSYVYFAEGSESTSGHEIEYQFDWGDGTVSAWSPSTSASKSWSAYGTFTIRAKARCTVHKSTESDWSEPLTITIVPPPVPDLTGQWISVIQTCRNTESGLKCEISGTFNIRNVGTLDAPSSLVIFYLSTNFYLGPDIFLKRVATGTVEIGKTITITLSFSLPLQRTASGACVIAVIDADNTVAESNEGNNVVFGLIP